jgi:hypothetical protein
MSYFMDFDKFFKRVPSTGERWLLFLPGACVASALVILVFAFCAVIARALPIDSDWVEQVLILPASFALATAVFIIIGATIAPASRIIVAVILAFVPVAFVAIVVAAVSSGFHSYYWPQWQMALDIGAVTLGFVVGIIWVLFQSRRIEPRN